MIQRQKYKYKIKDINVKINHKKRKNVIEYQHKYQEIGKKNMLWNQNNKIGN